MLWGYLTRVLRHGVQFHFMGEPAFLQAVHYSASDGALS